jgi:hypothetical protein
LVKEELDLLNTITRMDNWKYMDVLLIPERSILNIISDDDLLLSYKRIFSEVELHGHLLDMPLFSRLQVT